jgi:hypothetical protein
MDRVELLPNSEQIALHCTLSNEKEWEPAVALSESRRLDVDICTMRRRWFQTIAHQGNV